MSVKKNCLTCRWEPTWAEYYYRAQCKFPTNKKNLNAHGLPQGVDVRAPWIRREGLKSNCPAWMAKDGAE